jgi:hypothetical protein
MPYMNGRLPNGAKGRGLDPDKGTGVINGHRIGPRASLKGADLARKDLTGANLQSAVLIEANLSSADLNGANLNDAKLVSAELYDANLTDAKLIGADLTKAYLFLAKLKNADLTDANLTKADMSFADLSGATLTGADLSLANFYGATVEPEHYQMIEAALKDVLASIKVKTKRSRNPKAPAGAANQVVYYHCCLTKQVPSILKKGILLLQRSNWLKGNSGERYGGGFIYAFENHRDALLWARNWDWQVSKKPYSGDISIVQFTADPSEWMVDDNDPITQSGSHGRWLKKDRRVPPSDILSVEQFTMKSMDKLR